MSAMGRKQTVAYGFKADAFVDAPTRGDCALHV